MAQGNVSRPRAVKIGTRGSPLALAQARMTAEAIERLSGGALVGEIKVYKTTGDQLTTERLINSGGKGLFTKEIDAAVDRGEVDIAVHSLKDVPSALPPGQAILAYPEREDPRDGFLSPHAAALDDLPQGAVLGTASLRREAQARHRRPDLNVVPFRGSVETRLRKLEEGRAAATFLALAGLRRLGLADAAKPVPVDQMLPAACQGIVAVAACPDRLEDDLAAALAAFDHAASRRAAAAERAFLAALDGSCRTPIAALFQDGRLRGEVLTPDGARKWTAERAAAADMTEAALAALGVEAAGEIREAAGGDLPQFEG